MLFGQLATGQTNTAVLANYADADIANGKISFNGVQSFGSNVFLTLGATGKINNSVSQIFDGFKLNSNTSFDLRLNFNFFKRFYYSEKDAIDLYKSKEKLKRKEELALNQTKFDSLSNILFINISSLSLKSKRDTITVIRQYINHYDLSSKRLDNSKLAAIRITDSAINIGKKVPSIIIEKQDSGIIAGKTIPQLSIEYYKLLQDSIEIKSKIDSAVNVRKNDVFTDSKGTVKKNTEKELDELEANAPFSSFHMVWITGRLSPSRQKFYLYDSLQSYKSQITDTGFTSAFYGGEINYYYWSRDKKFSFYSNIGFGYQRENNLDSLDTYDVAEERASSSVPETRKVTSKYSAYSGKYREFGSTRLYANVYLFSGSNNSALHFFPEFKFWKDGPTVINMGLGFVMSFKSRKDEKTIINAEPFIQWNDLGNKLSTAKTNGFFRNTIGLRVGLPFNPVQAK